jgi:hypothetical protein
VILDTNRNIFGGFTPVELESPPQGKSKADASLKSSLFTLKNPHNVLARRFALKANEKIKAIDCSSNWSPCFGVDINVYVNCNANTNSFTPVFGRSYTNDTGLDGKTFFTGSQKFNAKEIEMFEITD